ncbi:hypothetical protein PUN28_010532 [Cardiocondyla obscurior]|uniref:Ribosomal protein S7 n=1 Tax=Cardiocondyla obscurior TaxID=286306 RepID=A0AAW2FM85_9HYME
MRGEGVDTKTPGPAHLRSRSPPSPRIRETIVAAGNFLRSETLEIEKERRIRRLSRLLLKSLYSAAKETRDRSEKKISSFSQTNKLVGTKAENPVYRERMGRICISPELIAKRTLFAIIVGPLSLYFQLRNINLHKSPLRNRERRCKKEKRIPGVFRCFNRRATASYYALERRQAGLLRQCERTCLMLSLLYGIIKRGSPGTGKWGTRVSLRPIVR